MYGQKFAGNAGEERHELHLHFFDIGAGLPSRRSGYAHHSNRGKMVYDEDTVFATTLI